MSAKKKPSEGELIFCVIVGGYFIALPLGLAIGHLMNFILEALGKLFS